MSERVKPIHGLTMAEHGNIIAVISEVEVENGELQFAISNIIDPTFENIGLYGILVSDFIDHVAAMYAAHTGAKEDVMRRRLLKDIEIEERLKKRDIRRGNMSGSVPGKPN